MGKLAAAVGMTQTNFVNPHGLDIRNNKGYSTAADIAKLSIYAMRRNALSFIVRQPSRNVSVTGPTGERKFVVKNTNELIGEPGILGLKTGTTNAAGPCVVEVMDREPLVRTKADGTKGATPRRMIVVVLNNPNRFGRARALIEQGWSIYDPWLAAGAPVGDRKREILAVPAPRQ
jgi:D-alanyl-D-alanine carboxypeptidase